MKTTLRGIHRRTIFEVNASLVARLKAGINQTPTDRGCLLWTGAVREGYGAIKQQGKVLSTHVVAWVIANGQQVPEGCKITHDCDVRLCCNPEHLKAGTATSNVHEMFARRSVRTPRGEMKANAVLTADQVKQILALKVCGLGTKAIADRTGFSFFAIRGVVERKTWKHIPFPTREEADELTENT
jgi:hypothetical protein